MHTILLVDDERWVRTAIRKTIERTELPFQVSHECVNGLEALDWLKENTVDLVLADIRMPVMDGLQFIGQLRELRPSQKAVIVSGHDDFSYVRQALRMEALDYLLKPVEVEEMRDCLQKCLKANQLRSSQSEPKPVVDVAELSPIEQVIRFIKDRLPGEVTLKDAAAAVHLNPSYLSQLFKQRMNQTFVDYVVQLRMDEAEKLLAHTSLRISEISERLGYADLSYFSNTFKRLKGRSPSEYRKDVKNHVSN